MNYMFIGNLFMRGRPVLHLLDHAMKVTLSLRSKERRRLVGVVAHVANTGLEDHHATSQRITR